MTLSTRGVETTATVTSLYVSEGARTNFALAGITFRLADGTSVASEVGNEGYRVGQQVPVVYDPASPQSVDNVAHLITRMLWPLGAFGCAVLCSIVWLRWSREASMTPVEPAPAV
ncbi:hypothetical protein [Kineococcus xinjiangensis]|uniref:hypothetical protein n=1 Tax=Kineococcus xinjiangensis TaxID=512762 RepID=UPI003CCB96E6